MKNDPVLTSLINFLVPIILLYGLFCLADFFANGFFAFIYSIVLFVSGFMIFAVRFSGVKASTLLPINLISVSANILSLIYIAVILTLITNIFAL